MGIADKSKPTKETLLQEKGRNRESIRLNNPTKKETLTPGILPKLVNKTSIVENFTNHIFKKNIAFQ